MATRNPSDPFLIPTTPSNRLRLSPTAANFTPTEITRPVVSGDQLNDLACNHPGLGHLNGQALAGPRAGGSSSLSITGLRLPNYGPIGRAPAIQKAYEAGMVADNMESERRNRAFAIDNVPTNLNYMSLAGFFNRREFVTLRGLVLTELSSLGRVYVAFTDSREAKKAIDKVRLLRPDWHMFPLSTKEYVQHSEPSLLSQASDYEGQLLVSVYYDSRNPTFNPHAIANSLQALATTFGDVKSFKPLLKGQENVSEFHLEFFNSRDAENAMVTLNGTTVDDCILEAILFRPDVGEDTALNALTSPSPVKDGLSRYNVPPYRNSSYVSGHSFRTPYMELSPTGRSTVPSGEHADLIDWMSRAGEGILPSPRREITRYPDARIISQNAVDIERIRLGLDVRTTIMLRNIPNKIDQTMLKAIVDESSHGKYDFMYLRIGRGSVVCELVPCYCDQIPSLMFLSTAIQGKDCLIQKFRNSSVMLEHPSFRPKIFHTGTGPLAGTEDRFPGPDNPSKMRRSIENAEHIGLFAPRVGQQYRDEQRRRRSQFDRGTTAAEREVVYVRTMSPNPFGVTNGLRSAPCTYPTSTIWYDPTIPERGPKTS
ncbi:putative meiosis protein MEI2 [Aspergillus clavatus NRRL 1]|uniref:Mei2-like C-terminal RNA recognition motif domain-containing protein n=1 Tax=Aspergillus clavatus (strain ATCC 1007 / CBS 513.65 / DSM 816 / NCTC 3887 / NRRL 1 / QM 1276 / 107) TaxID=344612 RepID=A1CM07_ASPCL|nr:uncharacterized protein ACLA_095270 [Aspergillus clavatus NRRL 1]EAW08594.1 conserved hypothetical protein [Aspergillus clavatus NRRL 1]